MTVSEQTRADASSRTFPAAVSGSFFLLTLGLFLYGALEGVRPWRVLLSAGSAV